MTNPNMSHMRPIAAPITERLDHDHDGIQRAARLLQQGRLVAFGTETVYGLGGLAISQRTVERIFTAKGRPSFNPLISHFASAQAAFAEAEADFPLKETALQLAEHFWPGPLTLILPRSPQSRICPAVTAGLTTLAVRVPKGRSVEALLARIGQPIAAPSANRSGRVSPSTAQHVLEELDGRIDAVLDTGPCHVGVESTVLDLSGTQPTLLRPGGITLEELRPLCGIIHLPETPPHAEPPAMENTAPRAPGQLLSHYAPSLPVRLNVTHPAPHEAFLAFGTTTPEAPHVALSWNLSPEGSLDEAAQRLFTGLRYLDKEAPRHHLTAIAVAPLPQNGLGRALQDRLNRAAAPRPTEHAPSSL